MKQNGRAGAGRRRSIQDHIAAAAWRQHERPVSSSKGLCGLAVERQDHDLHSLDFDRNDSPLTATDEAQPQPLVRAEREVRHGLAVDGIERRDIAPGPAITAIELLEIGAGGGSIARTKMGLITVGPDSSGAEPGPICYGRGGTSPTITDANLTLGYLNPSFFNGGAMRLEAAGAASAIEREVAEPLGLSREEAAWGIHSVANANMERAMRIVSIERGRDPRRYAMVAFGGAGPLHACRLARALEVPRVIVPRGAGVGSALGLLVADQKMDIGLTRVVQLNGKSECEITEIFGELERRLRMEVSKMYQGGDVRIERSASMHHVGQGYEIRVELPSGEIGPGYERAVLDAFYAAYRKEYGYNDNEAAVEVTDWYVLASIARDGKGPGLQLDGATVTSDPIVGERKAYFPEAGGLTSCKVINRYALQSRHRFEGPALVEERESTTVVLPGDIVSVTKAGNLMITIGGAK